MIKIISGCFCLISLVIVIVACLYTLISTFFLTSEEFREELSEMTIEMRIFYAIIALPAFIYQLIKMKRESKNNA